jgi:LmbE family N-acetylglucosaminyl deacetylase
MPETVAVIAAHPDDEVLGCGGTVARMAAQGRPVHILLAADGETSRSPPGAPAIESQRIVERNQGAEAACRILGCTSVELLAMPDNRMDGLELLTVVQRIEEFLRRYRPATVFTHHAGDVNIDHRIVHDAVIAACRPQPGYWVRELLFFEVPSATEWRPPVSGPQFNPNWFVDVSGQLATKVNALQAYRSELREFPHPRSIEAVQALARWRGATVGFEAAEAFVLGRNIIR